MTVLTSLQFVLESGTVVTYCALLMFVGGLLTKLIRG